jgi:alpha-L-fucosidase
MKFTFLKPSFIGAALVAGTLIFGPTTQAADPMMVVSTASEPMATGKFQPTWDSLHQYQVPDWFRDAKFGIWAHWGPQCEPEDGDWYARNMYIEGKPQNKFHVEHYGPPSQFGFKDVIHQWKAENWDPQKLMALYKRAGAQYFFALADHHDNFDLWDSKYQPWNSVKVGPGKDLIAGWAKAARDNGMRFGVSVHASHAWAWYQPAQGADKTGPYAGVPYDGKLTKADGKGQWWDGLDPQDLYAQNHAPGRKMVWNWDASQGSSVPDLAYCEKFYNRIVDLVNKYQPDLLYFDDSVLPLWPISDAGLKIAAHFYNSNMALHGGKLEAVMFNKDLNDDQKKCMTLDIERGHSSGIEPLPWQTDTCIGDWHYQRALFLHHKYKTARSVIQSLADIVSKNGNLLLNIPVRGDGTIDDDEVAVVQGIGNWMQVNKECIFGTRPWSVFGEGPVAESTPPPNARGLNFNEGKGLPFTADDIRYTTKGNILYAISLGVPEKPLHLKSAGSASKFLTKNVSDVSILGDPEKVQWTQTAEALAIDPPHSKPKTDYAVVYKITLADK